MKRKSLFILSLIISLLCGTTIYATEITYNPDYFDGNYSNGELINGQVVYEEPKPEEVIQITLPMQRIASNGTFTFDILASVTSTEFGVSADHIWVTTTAYIEGPTGDDVTSEYPNHRYTVQCQKKGFLGLWSNIGSNTFYADGSTINKVKFYTTDTNATYRLVIINNDYLPGGTTVVGNGSISNYVHP